MAKFADWFFLTEKTIKIDGGELVYSWKPRDELLDEEHDDYLPPEYKKILELEVIQAFKIGQGQGKLLMEKFLASPEAKKAHAIYLDINPLTPSLGALKGLHTDKEATEEQTMDSLERFYSKFGFKNSEKHARMWIDNLGLLKTLPT